jgi:hypothetical protein
MTSQAKLTMALEHWSNTSHLFNSRQAAGEEQQVAIEGAERPAVSHIQKVSHVASGLVKPLIQKHTFTLGRSAAAASIVKLVMSKTRKT